MQSTTRWSGVWQPSATSRSIALAEVLIDCVEGGASVSFMHPLSMQRAVAFWTGVAEAVARGERALIVAETPAPSWAPCNWCSASRKTSRIAPTSRRCWSIAVRGAGASVQR
jgi:hypothetical protein